HEAGPIAMLTCHATCAATEQRRTVGRLHGILAMVEVDLELPRADFRSDHRSIDTLQACRGGHVIEYIGKTRQPLDVHARLVIGITYIGVVRVLRQTHL